MNKAPIRYLLALSALAVTPALVFPRAAVAQTPPPTTDNNGAIETYLSELAAAPVAATTTDSKLLADTFALAEAYRTSTPPDYVACTFYASRAAAYAPEPFKSQWKPVAIYCYKKYHGTFDGYEGIVVTAKSNLILPPAFRLKITPAPPDDWPARRFMRSPQVSATLTITDKEFVLQNASPENAAKVWDTVKDRTVQIPDALVVESSPTILKVAVSDDAVHVQPTPMADFTFILKPLEKPQVPKAKTAAALAAYKTKQAAYDKELVKIAAATAIGQKVTLLGTYDSFTTSPIMILMRDGEVVLPNPPTKP